LRRQSQRSTFIHHDVLNLAADVFRVIQRLKSHRKTFLHIRVMAWRSLARAAQNLAQISDLLLQLGKARLHYRSRLAIGH